MLPTNHGFDEFFGNLYHLNAEEEPEMDNYPKDPRFKAMLGPRGVIGAGRAKGAGAARRRDRPDTRTTSGLMC
jgi:arylsulfatase A-like enzyme